MQLSSRQRVLRAIRRQPTDCVAVAPYMYDIAARITDLPMIDFCRRGDAMAEAQLRLHELLGQDVIAVGSDNYYIAEGLGCETRQNAEELPTLARPAANSLSEIGQLGVPDPTSDGRMPVMLAAIRQVRSAVGDEIAVRSPGTGPFALASYLIGTENWLYEVALAEAGMSDANEAGLHCALQLATNSLIAFGRACIDAGADILHCGDSLASCNVISPQTYERFAFPYQQQVFQAWHEHGAEVCLLHICGDSTKVLDLYATTGADVIEIDHAVDLSVAKQAVGRRAALMGNVHTVTELLQGDVAAVRDSAQRCIRQAGPGGGFVLGSGCIVPRDTPLENLQAMVDVARESSGAN
jgi:uroporphyrinogen decarboxylase